MKNILKKLQKDESGTMMIYLASMLPVFFLCLLIAIDGANAIAAKSKIGYTQDAVAIAYSGVSEEQLAAAGVSGEDYAIKFSSLNLENGSSAGKYKINLSENGNVITASSEAIGSNPTFFGKVAGQGDTELGTGKATKVLKKSTSSTTSQQALLGLVLDGSGSMRDHFGSLRSAVENLLEQTLEDNSDGEFWVSQVLYGTNIRHTHLHTNNFITAMSRTGGINYAKNQSTNGPEGMKEIETVTNDKIDEDPRFATYQKKIIFMTDGVMWKDGKAIPDNVLSDKCEQLRNDGYEIYGVAFGSGADDDVIEDCASDGNFYEAADEEELIDVFRAITTRIISSRISE